MPAMRWNWNAAEKQKYYYPDWPGALAKRGECGEASKGVALF